MKRSRISWLSSDCQLKCQWSVNRGVDGVPIEGIDRGYWLTFDRDAFNSTCTHDPSLVRRTPDQEVSHFDKRFLYVLKIKAKGDPYQLFIPLYPNFKCDNKVFTSKISQMTSQFSSLTLCQHCGRSYWEIHQISHAGTENTYS